MENILPPDPQLIDLYRLTGDQDAFTTLYRRYERFINGCVQYALARLQYRCVVSEQDIRALADRRFLHAVNTFKPERQKSFQAYLAHKLRDLAPLHLQFERSRSGRYGTLDQMKVDEDGDEYIRGEPSVSFDESYRLYASDKEYEQYENDELYDVFDYLAKRASPKVVLAVRMRMNGYTFDEIGRAVSKKSGMTSNYYRKTGKTEFEKGAKIIERYYRENDPDKLRF